ncbi:MAG: 16S rRNA (cytosine(967)-C(5))-methyltransferase RsmB [Chitinispirillia bacterium]|jgi:16S rRNA (cytosine967-C5)-methyltransferase
MKTRLIALKILDDFDNNRKSLKMTIDKSFRARKIDHRDKRLVFEIVYGVIRNRLSIDYVLNCYLNQEQFQKNSQLMWILRIGMYQIVFLDRIPDHAAVYESVNLAKRNNATQKFAGVVNAVLRKIVRTKNRLPKPDVSEDLPFRLSIQYSHPRWLIQRWLNQYGLTNTKKILQFNNSRPSIFLRRKLRGLSRQQFESDIKSICDCTGNGIGYKNLYYTLKKSLIPDDIKMLQDGYCTIQSASSGWVVALLDIQEDDKVLDLCAAPGGKTSLIAELLGKNGALCASDINFRRLKKVSDVITRMKLTNVFTFVCNGLNIPITGQFDKLLLDAPCSGTGVIHRNPDIKIYKSPDDIREIVNLQKELLNAVAPFVIPDGILVYSTCSLEIEENQLQIKEFISHHPEFHIEHPTNLIKNSYIDNNGFLFITPYEHRMDTMFAARLRKKSH